MPSVLTANRLTDGIVVYLGNAGEWVRDLGAASVAENETLLESLEDIAGKSVANQLVVGVYAMDVDFTGGIPVPKSVREKIRAAHRQSFEDLTEREVR